MRLLITLVLFSYISIAETITGTEGVVLDGFVSSPTPSSQAALNQYLILSSEFPEDLELIVENGYPTPEIREILTDESIPKEDRYWLDCRMRSKIAQILHRFYSENGDIIDIEADWVAPGEDYWQEIMMVSSSREDHLPRMCLVHIGVREVACFTILMVMRPGNWLLHQNRLDCLVMVQSEFFKLGRVPELVVTPVQKCTSAFYILMAVIEKLK
jgi:hypothetical protein